MSRFTLLKALDESMAQWLAHLPVKQKVPVSNTGGAAWHFPT